MHFVGILKEIMCDGFKKKKRETVVCRVFTVCFNFLPFTALNSVTLSPNIKTSDRDLKLNNTFKCRVKQSMRLVGMDYILLDNRNSSHRKIQISPPIKKKV